MPNTDPTAADFCRLYDLNVERIYRYHLVRTGSPLAAEDLTAETFFAAWESFGSFRKDAAAGSSGATAASSTGAATASMSGAARSSGAASISGAAAWLIGIARHKLADHFRRGLFRGQPRSVPLETIASFPAPGPSPETLAGERLELASVHAALRRLNPERAEALALHYFARLGLAEVGQVMGKSEDAAKKLVQRGLAELRQMLRVIQGNAEIPINTPARGRRANG